METTDRIDKAFERIRLRLLSFGITTNSSDNTVLTLASRVCGEGVTTIAFGLAAELSEEGKTLLIDANSEGTGIAESINVKADPIAVEHINRVNPKAKRYITQLNDSDIDILTLAISSKSENETIEFDTSPWLELRSYYKWIVVDSGSFQKPAARTWANWADHTLLVIDTTLTTREMLERFSSDLNRFDIKLSGFILNKRSFHIPGFLWSKVG